MDKVIQVGIKNGESEIVISWIQKIHKAIKNFPGNKTLIHNFKDSIKISFLVETDQFLS